MATMIVFREREPVSNPDRISEIRRQAEECKTRLAQLEKDEAEARAFATEGDWTEEEEATLQALLAKKSRHQERVKERMLASCSRLEKQREQLITDIKQSQNQYISKIHAERLWRRTYTHNIGQFHRGRGFRPNYDPQFVYKRDSKFRPFVDDKNEEALKLDIDLLQSIQHKMQCRHEYLNNLIEGRTEFGKLRDWDNLYDDDDDDEF